MIAAPQKHHLCRAARFDSAHRNICKQSELAPFWPSVNTMNCWQKHNSNNKAHAHSKKNYLPPQIQQKQRHEPQPYPNKTKFDNCPKSDQAPTQTLSAQLRRCRKQNQNRERGPLFSGPSGAHVWFCAAASRNALKLLLRAAGKSIFQAESSKSDNLQISSSHMWAPADNWHIGHIPSQQSSM